MRSGFPVAPLALVAALAVTVPAAAEAPVPLSSIAALSAPAPVKVASPRAVGLAGVTLKSIDHPRRPWHELTATTSRGFCIAAHPGSFQWSSIYTVMADTPEEVDLTRLVDNGGQATLEKTRIVFDPHTRTITPKSHSSVALREVGRGPEGVVVWAYRDGQDVIVLATKVDRGFESPADLGDDSPFLSGDGCPYAGARLDVRTPDVGAFVQLGGALPASRAEKDRTSRRFVVDASVSRVARDPEPMLAVRVRVRE